MTKNVLAAIDLADPVLSGQVLDQAEKQLGAESGVIHVLTVAPTYSMSIVGSYFPKDFELTALEGAKKELKTFLNAREDHGARIKGHVAHGVIYDEIMKSADKLGCELIVMAAHRPELKDYLLGPNAARVVRHANQSVYVVRQ